MRNEREKTRTRNDDEQRAGQPAAQAHDEREAEKQREMNMKRDEDSIREISW